MSKPNLTLIVNPNPEKLESKEIEADTTSGKFYATLVFDEYTLPSGDKPMLLTPEFSEKISDWAKNQLDPMQAKHHVQCFLIDYGIRLRRRILKEMKDKVNP